MLTSVSIAHHRRTSRPQGYTRVREDEIGSLRRSWVAELNRETLAAVRAQLGEDEFAQAWEAGAQLTVGEAIRLPLVTEKAVEE
jgi:hypothetical protein